MYQQLRQDLLGQIRRGKFSAGDLLPSESKLCERYGVSATTARRALLELVKEGVVYRKAGVGTMVASRVRQARLAFLSIDFRGDAWRRTPSAMGEIVAGLGEASWQRDAALSIRGVERDVAATYLRELVEERSTDGVLLRTADDLDEELIEILESGGMPYVAIKRHVPGRQMNCVVSDDVVGARLAVEHLLGLGHRRIAFVCAKPHITFARERLEGYQAALRQQGIEPERDLIRRRPNFTAEEGYRAMKDLLGLASPPGAVFVASDTMALGAYRAARESGLSIPSDVSLIGYDDISPSAMLQPPLTTVRTSYYDFGHLAAELLLDLVEGRETTRRRRVVEPVLIVRDSTAPVGAIARPRLASIGSDKETPKHNDDLSLGGREVAIVGSDAGMAAQIEAACAAGGARLVEVGKGGADALFHCFQADSDLGAALDRAEDEMGGYLGERPGFESALLLVRTNGSPGAPHLEALRAGLGLVVRTLVGRGEMRTRINAVVLAGDDPHEAIGPALFMALEENLSGEVLVLKPKAQDQPGSMETRERN